MSAVSIANDYVNQMIADKQDTSSRNQNEYIVACDVPIYQGAMGTK